MRIANNMTEKYNNIRNKNKGFEQQRVAQWRKGMGRWKKKDGGAFVENFTDTGYFY